MNAFRLYGYLFLTIIVFGSPGWLMGWLFAKWWNRNKNN